MKELKKDDLPFYGGMNTYLIEGYCEEKTMNIVLRRVEHFYYDSIDGEQYLSPIFTRQDPAGQNTPRESFIDAIGRLFVVKRQDWCDVKKGNECRQKIRYKIMQYYLQKIQDKLKGGENE